MHYTTIRLAVGSTTVVDLPIQDAISDYTNPFICKGVDGLGPADIDVAISRVVPRGGVLQNKIPQNRQIIMRIGLNPDWSTGETPADLREIMYALVTGTSTSDVVNVIFLDGVTEVCRTSGYISKFETVPFSKDPQVQITIECLQPYFEKVSDTVVAIGSMSKSAPSWTNEGSALSGFHMKITLTAAYATWAIKNQDSSKWLRFNSALIGTGANFASGDVIEFDTTPGKRNAQITHSGVTTSLLSAITADSTWLELHSGLNTFAISETSFNWNNIDYGPKFLGV